METYSVLLSLVVCLLGEYWDYIEEENIFLQLNNIFGDVCTCNKEDQ